ARRDERVRRGDDFVARPDIEQPQRDVQRGRAAVETERVLRAAELREVFFKLRHVRPEAKRTVVERAGERGVNFLTDAFDLRGQVEIGNFFSHVADDNNLVEWCETIQTFQGVCAARPS